MLEKTLGEGTFGKVKLATHMQTEEKVAIKILDKGKMLEDQDDLERVRQEISIMKKLRHRNIIQLYEIMESKRNLYLVMENCENKELFDYIVSKKKLKEREACKFFQQIIDGIEYIHEMNICHRDLKPENILLDSQNNIKISDFGLSKIYTNTLSTPCGTPSYAPPEMLKGNEYNGLMSDIWSSGIILFAMLCGYLPFSGKTEDEICNKIIECRVELPDWLSLSAKDILKRILTPNPKVRLSISAIRQHKFFTALPHEQVPGIISGKDKIPVDDFILSLTEEFDYEKEVVRNLIENDKFDTATSVYYFCLKKQVRQGYMSISDMTSDKYLNFMKTVNNRPESVMTDNSTKITNVSDTRQKHSNSQSCKIDTIKMNELPIRSDKVPKHEKTISDKTNLTQAVKKPTIKATGKKVNYVDLVKKEVKKKVVAKKADRANRTPVKINVAKKPAFKKTFVEEMKKREVVGKAAQSFICHTNFAEKEMKNIIDLEGPIKKIVKPFSPIPNIKSELKRSDSGHRNVLELIASKLIGSDNKHNRVHNRSVIKTSQFKLEDPTELPSQEKVLERMINRKYRHFGVIDKFNLEFKKQYLDQKKAKKLTSTAKVIDYAEQVETSCERSVAAEHTEGSREKKLFKFGQSKGNANNNKTFNLKVEKGHNRLTSKLVEVKTINLDDSPVTPKNLKAKFVQNKSNSIKV